LLVPVEEWRAVARKPNSFIPGQHHDDLGGEGNVDSSSSDPKRSKQPPNLLGVGIAIGAGLGVAIGVALGNIALGIPIGMGVGVAIGLAMDAQRRKDQNQ